MPLAPHCPPRPAARAAVAPDEPLTGPESGPLDRPVTEACLCARDLLARPHRFGAAPPGLR